MGWHTGDCLTQSWSESAEFDMKTSAFTFLRRHQPLATWRRGAGDESEAFNTPLFYAGISFRAGDGLDP
jgi:hypothetical protein